MSFQFTIRYEISDTHVKCPHMSFQFTIRYEISDIGNHNKNQKKILFKTKKSF